MVQSFRGIVGINPLFHTCGHLVCWMYFWLLGTPTEEIWPGLKRLRDWHEYPQWKPENFARAVPNLSPTGLDLLSKMLQCDPAKRISAKAAMNHLYFDDLDKSQF